MSDLELKHIPSDFCVFTVKDFLWGNIYSEPVENGLQLVMDIGQQREVVSKQQFWYSKIWNTSKCALYPFSQTINIIQVDGKKQGGRGQPCFTPSSGCTLACLSPSSSVYSSV